MVQTHGILSAWHEENYTILPGVKEMIQFCSLEVPEAAKPDKKWGVQIGL